MATPKQPKQKLKSFRIIFSHPRPYDCVEAAMFSCLNDNVTFFDEDYRPIKAYTSKAGVSSVEEEEVNT